MLRLVESKEFCDSKTDIFAAFIALKIAITPIASLVNICASINRTLSIRHIVDKDCLITKRAPNFRMNVSNQAPT
jgi:hypothetical protein